MRKKPLVLICVTASLFIFYSCDLLPTTAEIRGNPGIGIPLDVNENDLIDDDIFEEIKKSALNLNEHIKVMRYTGYQFNGKNIQAFLFQYMEDIPFNIDEHLESTGIDRLNNLEDELNIDPEDINTDIEMNDFKNLVDEDQSIITYNEDVSSIIDAVCSSINMGMAAVVGSTKYADFSIGPAVGGNGSLIEFDVNISGFDEVTYHREKIFVTLQISPGTLNPAAPDLSGVDITFSNVKISDGINEDITGLYNGSSDINLSVSAPVRIVEFDLHNKTLANNFKILIEKPADNSTPGQRNIRISAAVDRESFGYIRGVAGVNIDIPLHFPVEPDDLSLELSGDGFVHAEIEDGNVKFNFPEVPRNKEFVTYGWISGADIDSNITIVQNETPNTSSFYGGSPWQGLNVYVALDSDNVNNANDLKDKHLNTDEVELLGGGFTIKPGKASFWLRDEDVENKILTFLIKPVMEINSFSKMHVEVGELAVMPEPEPVLLGESAKYVKRIYFDEIGVKIKFNEVDIEGLTMELRIFDTKAPSGEYLIKTGFKPLLPFKTAAITTSDYFDVTPDANGDFELGFELELRLNGDIIEEIIEIADFDLDKTRLKVMIDTAAEHEGVEAVFDWSKAIADLTSMEDLPFSDSFPKEDEDKINLREMMSEYIEGFRFDNVSANLYIGIPGRFSEYNPVVEVNVWDGYSYTMDFVHKDYLDSDGNLKIPGVYDFEDVDKEDCGYYSALDPLPLNGIPLTVNNILNNPPGELRLTYHVKVDEVEITPVMLEKEDDDEVVIQVAALMVVPMIITADNDDAVVKIPGIFDSETDFINRSEEGESFIPDLGDETDLIINSLTVNISVSDVFTGGELYMRRLGETPGSERLKFPLSRTTLSVNISKDFLDYLNSSEGFPYYIEEVGIRFKSGDSLQIPSNMLFNIEFIADFSITFPLPEIGL